MEPQMTSGIGGVLIHLHLTTFYFDKSILCITFLFLWPRPFILSHLSVEGQQDADQAAVMQKIYICGKFAIQMNDDENLRDLTQCHTGSKRRARSGSDCIIRIGCLARGAVQNTSEEQSIQREQ